MAWKSWMLSAAVFCSALAACGDDDDAPAVTDMGGGLDMNTPEDLGPPTDAGTDAGPAAGCDPYADGSCGATAKCAVVIRNSGLPNFAITFECVPLAGVLSLGQVCNFENLPGGTRVDGGNVDFYDLCEQGTFCWDTPDIPGFPPQPRSCQPLCGAEGVFCGDTEYCQLLSGDDPASAVVEPTFGVCTPAAGCDPVFQTGCTDAADGCYLVSSTRGDILGTCLEVDRDVDAGTPFVPGTPCTGTTQCAPGAGCLPAIVDGAFGTGARACREYCEVAGSGGGFGGGAADAGPADAGAATDAGAAADAGTPAPDAGPADAGSDGGPARTGVCPTTLSCVAVPVGNPDAGMPIRVPTDPGLCQ